MKTCRRERQTGKESSATYHGFYDVRNKIGFFMYHGFVTIMFSSRIISRDIRFPLIIFLIPFYLFDRIRPKKRWPIFPTSGNKSCTKSWKDGLAHDSGSRSGCRCMEIGYDDELLQLYLAAITGCTVCQTHHTRYPRMNTATSALDSAGWRRQGVGGDEHADDAGLMAVQCHVETSLNYLRAQHCRK
jgi:hypothetical protein